MGRVRGRSLLVAGALIVALCGCTDTDDPQPAPPASSPTPSPTASTEPPPSPDPTWSLDDARVDTVPADPPLVESALPASFPADDAALPGLLADPPGRVRLAYHPRETFDDRDGWADERVFFLGTDGEWRSLEMVDLGLPEASHPGVDTYGAGDLSPDGTRWAAKTNDGIVLLDLRTVRSRVIRLPGEQTNYLDWRPDGQGLDVVRFSGASTYRTWSIDLRSLRTSRAAYRLPIDGYAHDGSVHTFGRTAAGSIHVVHRGRAGDARVVPIPYRLSRLGGAVGPTRTLFGLNRGMLVVDSTSTAPVARLRLRPRDAAGWPRGWLDEDTVWFYEGSRGLLTWNVTTGEVGTLTRVRRGTRPDSYWTASVAIDLMR
jgi:hypothetical protein